MNSPIAILNDPVVWIVVGVILAILVGRWFWRRRRKDAWQALARRLGFNYMDEDGRNPSSGGTATEKEIAEVKSFDLDCLRGGYHFQVLMGREGKDRILVADYEETRDRDLESAEGANSVREEFPRTVCARSTAGRGRPRILVWHESDYPKRFRWFLNCETLSFPNDPEFAADFTVKSDDLIAAQRILNGGLMNFIKSTAVTGFHVEMDSDTVAIHYCRRCSPEEVVSALEQLRMMAELVAD